MRMVWPAVRKSRPPSPISKSHNLVNKWVRLRPICRILETKELRRWIVQDLQNKGVTGVDKGRKPPILLELCILLFYQLCQAYCVRMQSWRWVLAVMLAAGSARAQWEILPSGSTADLRGVQAIGNGVAWASGTEGTVLRTINDGKEWQRCATPPDAEHVDFRGVQAFDASTAIVMSSGKGALSRLYKMTDGCKSWKLVFTNPDADGFFDTIVADRDQGFLIGDPVNGSFAIFSSIHTGLEVWNRFGKLAPPLYAGIYSGSFKRETLFAASNSVLEGGPSSDIAFVTGGEDSALFHEAAWNIRGPSGYPTTLAWTASLPLAKGASAGAFSLAGYGEQTLKHKRQYVVVGGDYMKPDSSTGTSAFSKDGGQHWFVPVTAPQGYRSAVAYDAGSKTWITVGSNGTDISTDDGRNWRALRPNAELHEPADADQHWNALSLPFVVGPKGRIGKLRPDALKPGLPTSAPTLQGVSR